MPIYGQLSGGYVLKQVADILRTHGKNNYVCRVKDGEFSI